MHSISTIGLDIAKSVFQVHGVDGAGQVVLRRQLRRRQVLAFFQKLPPMPGGYRGVRSPHPREWIRGARIRLSRISAAVRQGMARA